MCVWWEGVVGGERGRMTRAVESEVTAYEMCLEMLNVGNRGRRGEGCSSVDRVSD